MPVKLTVHIFLSKYVFVQDKKTTGQLSCLVFQLSVERTFMPDFPIDQFCFFNHRDIDSSSYSFMAMFDKRPGIRKK